MTTVYLRPQGLLLDSVKFDSTGEVVYGYVVNGDWTYRSNGSHWFCFRSDTDFLNPVTHWKATGSTSIVLVPKERRGHWLEYNEPIAWAESQPAFTGDLQEFFDAEAIYAVNMTPRRPLSGFDDMDDDIAF